jgi:hypothetical protein
MDSIIIFCFHFEQRSEHPYSYRLKINLVCPTISIISLKRYGSETYFFQQLTHHCIIELFSQNISLTLLLHYQI